MNASRTPCVPAVERALSLMESLAHSKNGLSLSQLVESSNLPKSSIHCLLLTLERTGYLHRSEQTGRYMFGLKLFGFANTSLSSLPIREQAAPFLLQLMEQTRLTVHMGVMDKYEAVLIARYDPPGSKGLATWRGKRMEVHCTGIGKALGAHMPEADLKALHRLRKFPRHNENTISTLGKLQEDHAKTRQRGYSIDDEEDEIGWRCLGAAIYGDAGSPSGRNQHRRNHSQHSCRKPGPPRNHPQSLRRSPLLLLGISQHQRTRQQRAQHQRPSYQRNSQGD